MPMLELGKELSNQLLHYGRNVRHHLSFPAVYVYFHFWTEVTAAQGDGYKVRTECVANFLRHSADATTKGSLLMKQGWQYAVKELHDLWRKAQLQEFMSQPSEFAPCGNSSDTTTSSTPTCDGNEPTG